MQHRLNNHDCTVHTADVLHRLGLLMPCSAGEDLGPVGAAELADWIDVDSDAEPEIAGHGWQVGLGDEVGLFVRPDHDDLAELLGRQAGVRSVVQLDREVFAVDAPRLCADGLRAAVMQAVAAANVRAHDPYVADQQDVPAGGEVHLDASTTTSRPTQPVEPEEDDDLCRLVCGDAASGGRRVQVWVNMNGILILPAGTIPHGPLDQGENPRFQRATVTPA